MPNDTRSWIVLGMTLAFGVALGGCGATQSKPGELKLGDDCSVGFNPGIPDSDPCLPAGLACTFVYMDGGLGSKCEPPFGSVDGGRNLPCGNDVECGPYGLVCDRFAVVDGGFLQSCQPPWIGKCAPNVGCAPGYSCTHDPDLGGDGLWCVQACETSSDCLLADEHCVLSMGQHLCANDRCGGSSGNGLPFQACDNSGMADGYCVPFDDDGSGSCYGTGLAPVGAFCEVGHSAFACAPGSICTFGQTRLDNTICFASCALPATHVHAPDGGPGCPIGQTCTQALSFGSFNTVAGSCVEDCSPSGGTPCPAHTTCVPIEDGGYGCLN